MRRLIASGLLSILCSFPALAQTDMSPPALDPARVRLGENIFDLTAGKVNVQSQMTIAQQVISQGISQNPALAKDQATKAEANVSTAASGMGPIMRDVLPQMREAYANALAQRFSLEELQAIKAFYESPAGAKLAVELPNIGREALQIVLPKIMSDLAASRGAGQLPPYAPVSPAQGAGP